MIKKVTDINKIKMVKILYACQFWVATAIVYFTSKNFTIAEAYQIIGLYTAAIVLLEFPTGVVGDYFSHRKSVIAGCFILAIGYFLFSFNLSFAAYLSIGILLATGQTLISGSDNALFYTISKNFRHDYAETKVYALIVSIVSMAVGGWLAAYNLKYPIYLTATVFMISGFILLFIKEYEIKQKTGNIYAFGVDGLKQIRKSKELLYFIVISSLLGGFFMGFKWFFNPLYEGVAMPLRYWGLIMGITIAFTALGTRIYKNYYGIKLTPLPIFFAILLSNVAINKNIAIFMLGLFLLYVLRGYYETYVDVQINHQIENDDYRASILSFNSLLARMCSFVLIAGAGFALDFISVTQLILAIVIIWFVSLVYFVVLLRNHVDTYAVENAGKVIMPNE